MFGVGAAALPKDAQFLPMPYGATSSVARHL